jgi:D-sedoheptulose 7-phosphate isomerase
VVYIPKEIRVNLEMKNSIYNDTLDLNEYFGEYINNINPKSLFSQLEVLKSKICQTSKNGGKVVFAGNGASAAIASHVALDFTKQAGIRSVNFHDPAFITAFVNDFGGEYWLSKACEMHVDQVDLVVFISVSGESPNLVNAAKDLAKRGIETICFTGKFQDNKLGIETNMNFWVDSHAYNIVECIHMIWLTSVIDMIIGKSEYTVS